MNTRKLNVLLLIIITEAKPTIESQSSLWLYGAIANLTGLGSYLVKSR